MTEVVPEATPAGALAAEPIEVQIRLSRSVFSQGLTAYSAGDYTEAARWWGLAYDMMADKPELVDARHVLALDLGQAELNAYEQDHLAIHLISARTRVEEYLAWVARPDHFMTADEREDQTRAVDMLTRIATLTASSPSPGVDAAPSPPSAAAASGDDQLHRDLTRKAKSAKRLIIAGSVFTTGALAGAVASIVMRARSQTYYRQVLMGGDFPPATDAATDRPPALLAATTILAAIGIPMLSVGIARRKRVRRQLELTPMAAGFAFNGRF